MRFASKTLFSLVLALSAGVSNAGFMEHILEKAAGKAAGMAADKYKENKASTAATPAMPTSNAPGFAGCPGFFPGGHAPRLPADAAGWKTRELCYDSFAVLHSGATRTPVYSVERLTRAQIQDAKDEERTNVFFADARLPKAERAELSDYVGSGFDRGHMSPAGDQPNAQSMAQSFSLANMIPQAPKNNQKTWRNVESSTRKYVQRAQGNVFVFTGPAFTENAGVLKGRVVVPSHLYKLVYDEAANRAWAYWLPNTDDARMGPPIDYAEFTRRLGFEMLPGLSPQH